MPEKHLVESGWKTLVLKHRIKDDDGLGKALANYARLGESGSPGVRLESVTEIGEIASKLSKDKAFKTMEDVVDWLDEIVKETARLHAVLTLELKSIVAKDKEEGELLTSLNHVRSGKGETQLECLVCVAKRVYGIAVARNITHKHKEDLTKLTASTVFLAGMCTFEDEKLTFVMETVKPGLAKQIRRAIKEAVGKDFGVRVRDAGSTTVLDDETDTGEDLEIATHRLAAVIVGIQAAAGLKIDEIASLLQEARAAASEAGLHIRKSDSVGAASSVEKASELLREALAKAASISPRGEVARSGRESGYPEIGELNTRLLEAVERCPLLERHLRKAFGGAEPVQIVFSESVEDAFFSTTGRGDVRGKFIVLPMKGRTVLDQIDALLFESCNAEIQEEFDELNKDFVGRMKDLTPESPPMSLRELGRRKAEIESKSVLKNAQLLFAARHDGVEIAYQGQRNLLAMLKVCRGVKGETLDDYEQIRDDPDRLAKYLAANAGELGGFLKQAATDEEIKKAILVYMAGSPHKTGRPEDDKNGLNSDDLYAYEALENTSAQLIGNMFMAEILSVMKLDESVAKQLKFIIQARLRNFDIPLPKGIDPSARNAVVLELIEELRSLHPQLESLKFESFEFTGAMTKMAMLQREKMEKTHGEEFKRRGDEELKLKDKLKNFLTAIPTD